ncbi:hypothetical protein LIER_28781 [Lithospermum erythrorhizon]|uniref:Reverse transcriptase domain-containing protein n=1 Tax=Lithospermum erythrorhizon TaxID=34254 RepID=A0AAV3RGU8_LITER
MNINGLTFVDDFIIFCNGSRDSVKETCNFLKHYEKVSGQSISREKTCFIVGKGASQTKVNMIARITRFTKGKLSLTYLGINVFKGAKSIFLFEDMISKIKEKVNDWSGKNLSYGGRLILVQTVLTSLPFLPHIMC